MFEKFEKVAETDTGVWYDVGGMYWQMPKPKPLSELLAGLSDVQVTPEHAANYMRSKYGARPTWAP
jgi:hypothetical protein